MKKLIRISVVIFCLPLFSQAQSQVLTLILNQNIYIPGQDLWYGILLNDYSKTREENHVFPTVHLTLADKNNAIIIRQLYTGPTATITGKLKIPLSLQSGTYILTAAIYDGSLSVVLEEESAPVHILGDEKSQYFTFSPFREGTLKDTDKMASINPSVYNSDVTSKESTKMTDTSPFTEIHKLNISQKDSSGSHTLLFFPESKYPGLAVTGRLREKICFKDLSGDQLAMLSISNVDYITGYKIYSFSSTRRDYQYGYSKKLFIDSIFKMPGFYDVRRGQIHQFKKVDQKGGYQFSLPNPGTQIYGQYIDLISKELIEKISELFPGSKWTSVPVEPLDINNNQLDSLKFKLEKSEVFSRIFNQREKENLLTKIDSQKIVPDNFIDLSKYQLFESIELFLTEAVEPVKIIKTREKKPDLRILRTDIKNYYTDSPLLLVNGVICRNIDQLFQIPYREISSIALYRKINTTRKAFGPLGRFGVIEVTTLPTYTVNASIVKLIGIQPELEFPGNNKEYPLSDPIPWFSSLQYFGPGSRLPFCYSHNDEKGTFRLQIISTTSRKVFYFSVNE